MGNSITPITVKQNMFMLGNTRWSPKGICYQPVDDVDPISDDNLDTITSLFNPATKYGLSNLNINCMRVYQVDPSKPHDKVMQFLASKGIYVMVGTVTRKCCVTGLDKSIPGDVMERMLAVADAFARYDNVLGFDISNELQDVPNVNNHALIYILRLMKQRMQAHMAAKKYRAIPIGCVSRDDPKFTYEGTDALICGAASERMDFIGYNLYRWSVPHGQQPSISTLDRYYDIFDHFKNYPVPVTLTEIGSGCDGGRDWLEISYVFGQNQVKTAGANSQSANMSDAISGCFAFRYDDREDEHFGLTKPGNPTNPEPITPQDPDGRYGGYDQLSSAYKNVKTFSGSPNGVNKVDCSSLKNNRYADYKPPGGGLPKDTTVTMTNDINNPSQGRKIRFNHSFVTNPGTKDWSLAVEIPNLNGSKQFTFPAGTQAISMVFQGDNPNDWYEGCQLRGENLLKLKDGNTIRGQWMAPEGHGSCVIK